MAFFDEAIPMIRALIGDIGATLTYSDDRLEELLCVACKLVIGENINFDYDYSVVISTHTLSPDPIDNGDTAFFNFVCLKAACFCDQNTLRSKSAISGISARMGPATLDTTGLLAGFLKILEQGPCKAYDQLKMEYTFGNSGICRVILSPFVSNEFDPQNLTVNHNDDTRSRILE